MPTPAPQPGVLRVELVYGLTSNQLGSTRWFYSYTGGPPTDSNLNTLAADIGTLFGSNLAGLMSSDYAVEAVNVTDLSSSTAAVGSSTSAVAGTRSGAPPTVDAVLLANSTIARRYRGGRPRIYFPFGCDSDLNSARDSWSSTLVNAFNSDWVSFNVAVIASTGIGCTLVAHVNISAYSGFASVQNPVTKRWKNIPTPRPVAITPDVIITTTARALISQQKRRRSSTTP
jgi:hypothetical protein